MTSKVSLERFTYNLGVLAGLTDEKAGSFNSDMGRAEAFKYWLSLVKNLKEDGFFKQPRREAHI